MAHSGALTSTIDTAGHGEVPPEANPSIHLVYDKFPQECRFWLGLNRKGSLSPRDLLHSGDPKKIMTDCADLGTREEGNLMLTDAESQPPRFYLFVPIPGSSSDEISTWIKQIEVDLSPWQPDPVGIYLGTNGLTEARQSELILSIVQALVDRAKCRKIFMYCGAHGLNFVLQAALEARGILSRKGTDIDVYH
jgi:hypothetical protein